MDSVLVKRGRGRPRGSVNRPKQPALSPEEAEALKRELADSYAEAVAAQALASDRQRRIKARLRATFGKSGLQDVEALIVAAEERIAPGAPTAHLSTIEQTGGCGHAGSQREDLS